jgi:hypothetical protein
VWIALLVLGGVLVGGVISSARARHWTGALVLGAAAVLSLAAGYAWVPR